jgi:hypothetical protein
MSLSSDCKSIKTHKIQWKSHNGITDNVVNLVYNNLETRNDYFDSKSFKFTYEFRKAQL